MRLELQNQLTTIESKLSAEARLVNDYKSGINKNNYADKNKNKMLHKKS